MRMSRIFSQTLRDIPAEAEIPSHQLLLRAGFIRQLTAGVFSYLPLARRALDKIEDILREEMNAIGGQELTMPVVHPAELWKETGRWYQIQAEMGRMQDRNGREMALAMTHEEVVADLARREIRSYRQLPQLVYHIQTKWRDDPRPRAGLIRVREFTMKDSYSLDADWQGLDLQYRRHYQAYFNIFHHCGLEVIAVKSDVGMMGGQMAHEFMYLTPIGEDTLMICDECDYAANRQIARFRKQAGASEATLPTEKVATPDCKTIEELANFLGIDKSKTAKAVFMMATMAEQPSEDVDKQRSQTAQAKEALQNRSEQFVFAIVRGDMELNETKLANAIGATDLRPATEAEIRQVGAVPGYASPVGLRDVLVVVDDIIPHSPNLVAGANQDGFHLRNVNYDRDYQAQAITDIASAQDGDACPECGGALKAVRGVEVGNIFKLGTRYSEALGAYYLDQDGISKPIVMGSYGIGSGRLLACVAEAYHDEHGLAWPVTVAPYQVHLVLLGSKDPSVDVQGMAEKLYAELWAEGVEALYDDRNESPGVKFKDADLIGLPLRLTVSERAYKQGGVEFKRRNQDERHMVPLEQVLENVNAELAEMRSKIQERVVDRPFE